MFESPTPRVMNVLPSESSVYTHTVQGVCLDFIISSVTFVQCCGTRKKLPECSYMFVVCEAVWLRDSIILRTILSMTDRQTDRPITQWDHVRSHNRTCTRRGRAGRGNYFLRLTSRQMPWNDKLLRTFRLLKTGNLLSDWTHACSMSEILYLAQLHTYIRDTLCTHGYVKNIASLYVHANRESRLCSILTLFLFGRPIRRLRVLLVASWN